MTYIPKPGDAVFAETSTLYGKLIRAAQALRWWQGHSWNHMAIVSKVDSDGQVWCIQMVKQCSLVKIEDVAKNGHVKIVPIPADLDAQRAVAYAYLQLGIDYGVATIVSLAINLALPRFLNFDFTRPGTLICSGLVARSWEHGGFVCPVDPFQITPGQLDQLLGGGGTPVYYPLHKGS
jgi:hypothetical protein